ncbi:MAG: hypothetical protein HQL13_01745 [Candidatus Omnitrophica bacterium]|nr:hypothetical protein [Candidatus Omnitrophota bacterium]
MAQNSKRVKQISIEEYNKIKEKIAKSKLKLQFPLVIRICLIVPLLYGIFLILYFLIHVRFVAEH